MKKHLGWVIRLLIAAAGIGYILYTLDWSDRVELPPGYVLAEGFAGGEKGRAYDIGDESGSAYRLMPQDPRTEPAWIDKAELTPDASGPTFKPSFMTILSRADAPLLLGGLAIFAPVFLIGAARWSVLMRARGIEMRYWRVYRLTMAGQFFNLCMPGTTGGDVMKAYYAAKGTQQRADAVVSIAIDRVCGLVGLMVLVALAGLASLDDPIIHRITIGMWVGLLALVLTGLVYSSPTIRARIRLGTLLGKVPGAGLVRKLDALVTAYRKHLGALALAIGLSLPIHICLALSMSMAGFALGVERPLLFLLGTVPIVLMLWSLPISGPLGLGPMDIVAVYLIAGTAGTTAQEALMMFVAYRLFAVAVGLSGALALLGSDAPSARTAKQAESESETPATSA